MDTITLDFKEIIKHLKKTFSSLCQQRSWYGNHNSPRTWHWRSQDFRLSKPSHPAGLASSSLFHSPNSFMHSHKTPNRCCTRRNVKQSCHAQPSAWWNRVRFVMTATHLLVQQVELVMFYVFMRVSVGQMSFIKSPKHHVAKDVIFQQENKEMPHNLPISSDTVESLMSQSHHTPGPPYGLFPGCFEQKSSLKSISSKIHVHVLIYHCSTVDNQYYTRPSLWRYHNIITLRPRPRGRDKMAAILKWIFLNENVWISIQISLKFVPWGPLNNIPSMVQIMAWHRPGDKPLSEPIMASLRDTYSASMCYVNYNTS